MTEIYTYLPEDDLEPLPVGEWFDELIWSPSQCYCRIQHQGMDYILYLRWRWTDPWQAYIIKNADSLASMNNGHAVWSDDVFEFGKGRVITNGEDIAIIATASVHIGLVSGS